MSVNVDLIASPYHLGHYRVGMGNGPEALLARGAATSLRAIGCDVRTTTVQLASDQPNEIMASFVLQKLVSEEVRAARDRDALPIALTGNCNTAAIGVLAGLARDVGIVWFDAHADYEVPEETTTGFQDGMGLSIATGESWQALREQVVGAPVVPPEHVVLVGTRDCSSGEQARLNASAISAIGPEGLRDPASMSALGHKLSPLASRVDGVYLHIDLDVLDPSEGKANEFSAPGGLTVSELTGAIADVGAALPILGTGITSYDPAGDPDGIVADAGLKVIASVVRASQRR